MIRDHFRVLLVDLASGRGSIAELDGRDTVAGGSGLAAMLFDQVAAQFDGIAAGGAGAQKDREQFGVREARCALRLHLLAILLGQVGIQQRRLVGETIPVIGHERSVGQPDLEGTLDGAWPAPGPAGRRRIGHSRGGPLEGLATMRDPVYWGSDGLTSVLFFLSVLLHELGHSVLALREKVPVKSITLFIFGGVAQIEREPSSPGVELRVAIAGPLVSFGLAGLFGAIWLVAQSIPYLAAPAEYLMRINFMLAVFNLIPGFPLDGGRVLRALVWQGTKDFYKATRVAATTGQIAAFAFIGYGLWQMFGNQFINGLKGAGFDTMLTTTAIVPVLCGTDERAFALTRECQHHDLFVLPVVSPAVPEGLARLRATVLASHEPQEIDYALGVIAEAGKKLGIIE